MNANDSLYDIISIYDDLCPESYRLIEREYGVKIEHVDSIDAEHVIDVSGPIEIIDRLVDDSEDGEIEPMCRYRDLSDRQYVEKMKNLLGEIGYEWTYNPDDYADIED